MNKAAEKEEQKAVVVCSTETGEGDNKLKTEKMSGKKVISCSLRPSTKQFQENGEGRTQMV